VKSVAETLGPTRVKLAVEVPFAELQPYLDDAYKSIAEQVNVPGFRKGRVPAQIIDQRFGRGSVLQEAINEALPDLYSKAVDEAEITPLGSPEVDITELEDGDKLAFTAEVDVRPEIEMPAWESIALTVEDIVVDEAKIDEQIEQLRRRFSTLLPVERAAAEGDHVTIDLSARDDEGEEIENGQATGLSYEVGSGTMVEGLDEAVTGLSAGDTATFTTRLLGGDEAGVEAEVDVTVTAVKEQELPDLDDEFAMMASEFDTLAELRADIEEQLTRGGRLSQALSARDKALEYLLDSVDVPLPEGLIAAQLEEHFADGHGDDDHRAEVEDQARRSLKAQLILDEIVKAAEVQVSQEEITQYLIERAQQSGMSPQDFADQMVRGGNVQAVIADVARGKALALVVEKASVADESGNPVELERLQEDGTIADEAETDESDSAADEAEGPVSTSMPKGVEFAEVVDATEVGEPDAGDDASEAAPSANTDEVKE
jgi:trigger factor